MTGAAVEVIQWMLVLLLCASTLALARQVGLLHSRIPPVGARTLPSGPDIGEPIPAISGVDTTGSPVEFADLGARPKLLVFVSAGCDSCDSLAPALRSLGRSDKDLTLVLLSRTPVSGAAEFAKRHRLGGVAWVVSDSSFETFEISTTPFAVAVDLDGRVRAKGIANTVEHLESLINAMRAADTPLHVDVSA